MANKNAKKVANVSVRVQPEIKRQAESVLAELGVPVSVLIDTLYRQIIFTGGIPYALTVPHIPTRDGMSQEEFDGMMGEGYRQAIEDKGEDVKTAFDDLRKGI